MTHQLRQFLGLEPSRPVGRWFSVVLVIGVAATLYSVITDWPHAHGALRLSLAVKAAMITVTAAIMIILQERHRRSGRAKPSA